MSLPLARKPVGASLIELLVVLFIIGMLMSLLMPALHRARTKADETVCENNLRQLQMGLSQFIGSKKRFPAPNHWTVDLLPWIEQRPLADIMNDGYTVGDEFARPPIMVCPFQQDFASRFPTISYCHFVLVVDRDEEGRPRLDRPWHISDRELIDDSNPQEPWYVGPEMSNFTHQQFLDEENGPHPGGRYDTQQGYWPTK